MQPINYRKTKVACYLGYIVQALMVNLPPLLYVAFSRDFGLTLERIGLLITVNFFVQMLTDIVASKYASKIGYRFCAVASHVLAVIGLVALGTLPRVMDPYTALVIAFVVMGIGGGMIEVIVSPTIDAIPSSKKRGAMGFLHSFYCWGIVLVILVTTGVFAFTGTEQWFIAPVLWAIVPLANLFLFLFVPIPPLENEQMKGISLFKSGIFWILLVIMFAAGSTEQVISQWSSTFAELGLHLDKAMGDLLGPCLFAVTMGITRIMIGLLENKIKTSSLLLIAGVICVGSYALTAFSPSAVGSLIGMAICGFGVGVAWPSTLTLAGQKIPKGGTMMFGLLALAGDIGCASGPALIGLISERVTSNPDSVFFSVFGGGAQSVGLKSGILIGIIFPLIFIAALLIFKKLKKKPALPLEPAVRKPE